MTDEQILEKAIAKAIGNGWRGVPSAAFNKSIEGVFISGKELLTWRFELWHGTLTRGEYDDYEEVRIEAIIFNHDFAKALWGEAEWRTDYSGTMGEGYTLMPTWMAHLQQMVIAPNRIKYLGENI